MASDLCTAMEDENSSNKIDLDGGKLVESMEAVEDSATSTKRKTKSKSGSSTRSKASTFATRSDLSKISKQMDELTTLVTNSFQKWGPIITEVSEA